jgi:hypothetical protein
MTDTILEEEYEKVLKLCEVYKNLLIDSVNKGVELETKINKLIKENEELKEKLSNDR